MSYILRVWFVNIYKKNTSVLFFLLLNLENNLELTFHIPYRENAFVLFVGFTFQIWISWYTLGQTGAPIFRRNFNIKLAPAATDGQIFHFSKFQSFSSKLFNFLLILQKGFANSAKIMVKDPFWLSLEPLDFDAIERRARKDAFVIKHTKH